MYKEAFLSKGGEVVSYWMSLKVEMVDVIYTGFYIPCDNIITRLCLFNGLYTLIRYQVYITKINHYRTAAITRIPQIPINHVNIPQLNSHTHTPSSPTKLPRKP